MMGQSLRSQDVCIFDWDHRHAGLFDLIEEVLDGRSRHRQFSFGNFDRQLPERSSADEELVVLICQRFKGKGREPGGVEDGPQENV